MKKKPECIRIDPEERICPVFDATDINLFSVPDTEEMGVRVVDDLPEEHIQ